MKLETEFYKLPVVFDANRVYGEISRIEPYRWVPQGSPGCLNLPMVSHHGLDSSHPSPPTWPTDNLERCPYLRQVLAHFRSALTDVRVRRVEPGTVCEERYDQHHASFGRYCLYLPLLTDPRSPFRCNGREVHMERGEVWVFDRMWPHGNPGTTRWPRVHITVDTTGSSALWNLIDRAERPFDPQRSLVTSQPERIEHTPDAGAGILAVNTPGSAVLPPGDLDCFMEDLLHRLRRSKVRDPQGRAEAVRVIRRFQHDWRTHWSLAGSSDDTWPKYRRLTAGLLREIWAIEDGQERGISDLQPGLGERLRNFVETGAFNPRASAYDIDSNPTPDTLFELLGEPLMRLHGDGKFDVWNPIHKSYVAIRSEEIDLLRCFAAPATVAAATDAAGCLCDEETLRLMKWFLEQHLVRPLRAMPGLEEKAELEITDTDIATDLSDLAGDVFVTVARTGEQPGFMEEEDVDLGLLGAGPDIAVDLSSERFAMRLQQQLHFRVTATAGEVDMYIWVPKLHAFRSLSWRWLRLISALATGVSVRVAAERTGIAYDDDVHAAISTLLDYGVLGGAAAPPAREPTRLSVG